MLIRIFLFFIIALSGLYIYISHFNPLDIKFQYYKGSYWETSLAILLITTFFLGAFLISLIYSVKDITRSFGERRGKREQEALWKWFYLATDALYKDDLSKAEKHIQAYIRKRADDPIAYIKLAEIYHRGGRPAEAIEVLQRAKSLNKDRLEILFKEAQIYKDTKDHQGAIQALEEVMRINPSNLEATRELRNIYVDEQRWEQALEIQKKIIKLSPEDQTESEKRLCQGLRYEYVRSVVDGGDVEKGMRELKEIIKEDYSFVPPQVLLGEVLQRSGDNREAIKVWRKGFEETHEIVFLTKLEDLYLSQEDPRGIIRLYLDAMEKVPDNIVIPFFYARLCLRLGMFDEALDRLKAMETTLVHHPMYHYVLADVYLHQSDYEQAAQEYRRGLELGREADVRYRCNVCYEEVTDWQPSCPKCGLWDTFALCSEARMKASFASSQVV